jgi:hypothetical protein
VRWLDRSARRVYHESVVVREEMEDYDGDLDLVEFYCSLGVHAACEYSFLINLRKDLPLRHRITSSHWFMGRQAGTQVPVSESTQAGEILCIRIPTHPVRRCAA